MDLSFWGYGLLASFIAVVFSSVELLTKYQARGLREIFLSWHFVGIAVLNALFCFLVYWAFPFLGSIAIKSDLLSSMNQPLSRALIAGLGYLLIARTSILDITVRGETLGVGLDAAYKVVAQYLLRHHSLGMRRKIRRDFHAVYKGQPNDAIVFLGAAQLLMAQLSDAEKTEFEKSRNLALHGQPPADALCLTLYVLIRDYAADREDAETHINAKRNELEQNTQLVGALKRELPWLYP